MKKWYWLVLVVAFYFIINIAGLYIPVVINAAKYAQVGREILDNHDWINLTIASDAYDQKPPLLFWIAALIFKYFGLSIVAYKAAILFISLFGIYGTFKLGELLYGKQTGILAAILWSTSLGYVHFHNDIHTDTLLVVPVILSIWQYAAYFKHRKEYQFYLGTIFIGLAMLTKGPVGMVIPGAAIGLHLLLKKQFKDIFNYRWLITIPIIGIIIWPALKGLYQQFGIEGIKFYFWTNNMGRITGSYHGSNTDPFFYIHTSLYMIAPWAVYAFTGIILQLREKFLNRKSLSKQDEFYTLGGIIFYFIISSIAKAKNPHYEMAILPLMLILAARWIFVIYDSSKYKLAKKVNAILNIILPVVIWTLIFLFIVYFFPEKNILIWGLIIVLLIASIYSFTLKNKMYKQLGILFFTITGFLITLNYSMLPSLVQFHSGFAACDTFNEKAANDQKLHIFTTESRYWDVFLYSKNYGRYIITEEDFKTIKPPTGDWLYTGTEGVKLLNKLDISVDTVKVFKHRSLSRISPKFLNPKTRESKLYNRYLVQIKGQD